ncbi:hypothetical protein SBY92_001997 [Candida maltosa Xu316]
MTDRAQILADSKSILESVPAWPHKRTINNPSSSTIIQTKTLDDGLFWASRTTTLPYSNQQQQQQLRDVIIGASTIGSTHSDHEMKYIHQIKSIDVSNITTYPDGWSYRLIADYSFGMGLKQRRFIEDIHVYEFPDSGYVISIPHLDNDDDDGFVRAKYHSIEKLMWDDDDEIKWIMATTSSAGGFIPDWMTNWKLPTEIAKDVPAVLHCIKP